MTKRRLARAALMLSALLVAAILLALLLGAEPVDLSGADEVSRLIVLQIRLPRVLAAALIGAILGMAGSTFQTLLRNPLADPFVLGVSGGAASAAAVAAFAGFSSSPATMVGAAFAGALLSTALVFLLARERHRVDLSRLLLSGLILNAFFSAVILLVLGFARGGDLAAALRWMMGSLSGAGWTDVAILAVSLVLAAAALHYISSDLRLLAFGEEDAASRGVRVERIKRAGFFVASLATGAAVAVSGVIGFVGLLIPHLVRHFWPGDFRVNMPLSLLGGAILMVLADVISRAAMPPLELPIGALLALLGVPFFIWILRSS